MYATHRSGHWWGDDWALYVRQARAARRPSQPSADRERVHRPLSDGPEFSPPLYPWGFPLLLAPFIAVVGDNLDTADDRAGAVRLCVRLLLVLARPPPVGSSLPGRRRRRDDHAAVAELDRADPVRVAVPAVVGVALVCLDRVAERCARRADGRVFRSCSSGSTAAAASRSDAKGWRWSAPSPPPNWRRSSPSRAYRGGSTCGRLAGSVGASHSPTPRSSAAVGLLQVTPSQHGRPQVRRHQRHQRVDAAREAGAQPRPGLGPAAAVGPQPDGARIVDAGLDRRRAFLVLAVAGHRARRCGGTAPATCTSPPTRSVRRDRRQLPLADQPLRGTVAPVLMVLALRGRPVHGRRASAARGWHAARVAGARWRSSPATSPTPISGSRRDRARRGAGADRVGPDAPRRDRDVRRRRAADPAGRHRRRARRRGRWCSRPASVDPGRRLSPDPSRRRRQPDRRRTQHAAWRTKLAEDEAIHYERSG